MLQIPAVEIDHSALKDTIVELVSIVSEEDEPGGVMVSGPLLQAITTLGEEVNGDDPDWDLIFTLSSVKSLIVSMEAPEQGDFYDLPYWEYLHTDRVEADLPSVYCILDDIHHRVARHLGRLGCGVSVMTSTPNGISISRGESAEVDHPLVAGILAEFARVRAGVRGDEGVG